MTTNHDTAKWNKLRKWIHCMKMANESTGGEEAALVLQDVINKMNRLDDKEALKELHNEN